MIIRLLFCSSVLAAIFGSSLSGAIASIPLAGIRDCLRSYSDVPGGDPSQIPWGQCLGSESMKEAGKLLQKGLFQQAAWRLQDSGAGEQAKAVLWYLSSLMIKSPVSPDQVRKLGMGGATKPELVRLPLGVRGVFKRKKKLHPSSSYKAEIAAYRIDQLFGFRLIPMTVRRFIVGKKGSMQYFIDHARPAAQIAGYKKSPDLNILDYLLHNLDRNGENILLAEGREICIDHGLSLRRGNIPGYFLFCTDQVKASFGVESKPLRQKTIHPKTHIRQYRGSDRILFALQEVKLKDLFRELKDLLPESEIKLVFKRQRTLLTLLNNAALLP